MRILTEASGSITSNYILQAIKDAGHIAVGSDITEDCFAKYIADDFIVMPKVKEENSWANTLYLVNEKKINIVIPSLDETLLSWTKEKNNLLQKGIYVMISDEKAIEIAQDKWKTYLFFKSINIPVPKTSLEAKYKLIKPRFGRGSTGIFINEKNQPISMINNISQEIIKGIEYTVDVFCNKNGVPVYIIPRKRLQVKEGKSTAGIVVQHAKIEAYIRNICSELKFVGPINIQCFEEENGEIKFIEINPRLGGGMALGFAASENWIDLIVKHFIHNQNIEPKPIKYNLKMMRFYNEVFTCE